jgi:hypothetical protein
MCLRHLRCDGLHAESTKPPASTLHVGGVGFQLVRDMPEAVGKMRLDYGDTPELGCGNPIKRRSLS